MNLKKQNILKSKVKKSHFKNKINTSDSKTEAGDNLNNKNQSFSYKQEISKKPYGYKKNLCKFFIKNACTKGEACTFSHEIKAFPCHAYHLRDNCTRKFCKFSHAPITIEQFKELKESDGKTENSYLALFKEDNQLI